MRFRKGLALVLTLALTLGISVSWCLADEDVDYRGEPEGAEVWEVTDEQEDREETENEETPARSSPFQDVPEDANYAKAVSTLAERGIITGDDRGNFNPDATITRAETAAIICRLMGVEEEAKSNRYQVYDDVPASNWASGYIAKATELGVFNGDGTGKFRPNDNVTYEQIIKMLVCVRGYDTQAQRAGGWPNGYISVAKDLGITSGVRFSQTANAPRSAVAMLAYNAVQ